MAESRGSENQSYMKDADSQEPGSARRPRFTAAVVGKTGIGKSSVCNQILGKNIFCVGKSFGSVTTTADHEPVENRFGCDITVVDTPYPVEYKKLICEMQIPRAQMVIVLCVSLDHRYDEDDYSIYQELKKQWGNDKDFCRRLVVAFTHGDELKQDSLSDKNTVKETVLELQDDEQPEADRIPVADKSGPQRQDDGPWKDNSCKGNNEEACGSQGEGQKGASQRTEEKTPEEKLLEKELEKTEAPAQLKAVMNDANNRYVIFNNKDQIVTDDKAVQKLINIVKSMDLRPRPEEQKHPPTTTRRLTGSILQEIKRLPIHVLIFSIFFIFCGLAMVGFLISLIISFVYRGVYGLAWFVLSFLQRLWFRL